MPVPVRLKEKLAAVWFSLESPLDCQRGILILSPFPEASLHHCFEKSVSIKSVRLNELTLQIIDTVVY